MSVPVLSSLPESPERGRRRWQSCSDIADKACWTWTLDDKHATTEVLKENEELKKTIDLQESQLTELHSVVAELKRKLEDLQEHRIEEEDEEDENNSQEEQVTDDDYFEDGIDDLVEAGCTRSSSARKESSTTTTTTDQNKLCKILSHLQTIQREHNDIKGRLEEKDAELGKAVGLLKRVRMEKEGLVKKVHHLQSLVQQLQHSQPGTNNSTPHCRYASRRKLQTQQKSPTTPTTLTGPTLTNIATTLNSCIVEKLINLNEAAMLGELSACSREQVELVLEKETLKVDKLQNEVDFLLGRLSEAKSVNEELVGVVGKIESWGMGWKVVAERGDSTIELYDILVALLESELGLLLANVKAAGIGITIDGNGTTTTTSGESIESLLKRAEFNRDTAMGAAVRVLGGNNNKNMKLGPRLLEHQIRSLIISLKTSSAQLLGTIPSYDFNMGCEREQDYLNLKEMKLGGNGNCNNNNRMDLETAVLMQELLSCREEKADLKMRLVCVERERDFLGGLILEDTNNCKTGGSELNNNETTTPPLQQSPTTPPSLNHLTTTYSLLHSSNTSLLKSLEDTKTKYRERVRLLENRIICLVGSK